LLIEFYKKKIILFVILKYKIVVIKGAAILKARKASSAASAANAICDHIHDW